MYSCLGSGSSPGRLNSINNGRPPGIQKMRSGYPVSPGVTSLEPMIPRCFQTRSQASCSILDSRSLMAVHACHGTVRRRHRRVWLTTHHRGRSHQAPRQGSEPLGHGLPSGWPPRGSGHARSDDQLHPPSLAAFQVLEHLDRVQCLGLGIVQRVVVGTGALGLDARREALERAEAAVVPELPTRG